MAARGSRGSYPKVQREPGENFIPCNIIKMNNRNGGVQPHSRVSAAAGCRRGASRGLAGC